jgi:Zn-dependent peptidase ImmA (M78 family)
MTMTSDKPRQQERSVDHDWRFGLGHYLLSHPELAPDEARLHIDLSEGAPPSYNWRAERSANEFAADLLMPRRLLTREFKRQSRRP